MLSVMSKASSKASSKTSKASAPPAQSHSGRPHGLQWLRDPCIRQHASAHVRTRQQAVRIHPHTSAGRAQTSADVSIPFYRLPELVCLR
jgi:hypothetical protein